ncbi:MAG TPA: sulfate ABC transporter permease subunit CysT [Mycobacteriales bacterium]|nr:sulfate ABC transporter permease subunit CysT [Mycobacteriales bacterium]
MAAPTGTATEPPPPTRTRGRRWGAPLGLGLVTIYLSLIVLIPLAAVVWKSADHGASGFWSALTSPQAWASLKLTVLAALVVSLINLVMGTLIAWMLVRDRFPGIGVVDTIIDLPLALPTIVAGLVLLALYGPGSVVDIAYARTGVVVALLFVTLPFVVRTVQPVLLELDQEMEEAAASLGASRPAIIRRIVLPNLLPAMLAGTALSFARAVSEFGSTVLISGNIPFKTEVAAVNIYNQIESDNTTGAAALSTALLVIALVVMLLLELVRRWAGRHD